MHSAQHQCVQLYPYPWSSQVRKKKATGVKRPATALKLGTYALSQSFSQPQVIFSYLATYIIWDRLQTANYIPGIITPFTQDKVQFNGIHSPCKVKGHMAADRLHVTCTSTALAGTHSVSHILLTELATVPNRSGTDLFARI